jgi:hypothetical protein
MAALTRSNPLPRWQRRGVQLSMTLLAASGGLWLVAHYAWGAGAGELPHPLEAWMMRLHGAALLASLFFLGSIAPAHVSRGWRLARQRTTGLLMLGGMALLVASGYALYYFAPEPIRPALGNAHAALGLVLAGVLAWHGRAPRDRGVNRA